MVSIYSQLQDAINAGDWDRYETLLSTLDDDAMQVEIERLNGEYRIASGLPYFDVAIDEQGKKRIVTKQDTFLVRCERR